jgi:hypothetical protein
MEPYHSFCLICKIQRIICEQLCWEVKKILLQLVDTLVHVYAWSFVEHSLQWPRCKYFRGNSQETYMLYLRKQGQEKAEVAFPS